MNRKKVIVTMLAALAATSAWSDVSVMAESTGGGASYVEKGSATGDIAVAVGTASEAKGGGTIAIGRAHATSGNAVAIGTDATADKANSVALGANSSTTEEYTVSVGNAAGVKRRIVNVDAGRNDNDVVIMKQFKEVKEKAANAVQKGTINGASSIAIVDGSQATGSGIVAIGARAKGLKNNSIAIGTDATTEGDNSIALGQGTKASGWGSVAIGNQSQATDGTVSVGNATMKRRITNIADGQVDNDAVNMKQLNEVKAKANNAVQAGTIASGHDNGAIYNSTVYNNWSYALGNGASVKGEYSTALGFGAKVENARNAVALGANSQATEGDTVSVGNATMKRRIVNVADGQVDNDAVNMKQLNEVKVKANNAVQAGTIASGHDNGAIYNSTVYNNWSYALGNGASVKGEYSTALGFGAKVENARNAVALGANSQATEGDTVSVGNATMKRRIVNVADGQVDNDAVNMKQLNEVKKTAENAVQKGNGTGSASQAVGTGSNASGSYALAVGNNSNAGGMFSISMGWGSQTGNNQSVAIGHDAKAQSAEAVAIGNSAIAQQVNAISIGNNSVAGLSNEGYDDPIWYAIGDDGKPLYSTSDPNGNRGGARSGAVAVGNGAKALGYRNIAIGENAITAKSKLKDGEFVPNAGKNNPEYTEPGVIGSIAIGGYAITEGSHSTVIGNAAYALGNYTSAYGIRSYAYGKDSSAFGNSATTMGKHSVAVGSYARADHDNSVALGSGSITDKAESTASYTIEAGKAAEYVDSITGKKLEFAGSEAYGTVSVGGKGIAGYTGDADENGTLNGYKDPFNGKVMMDKPIYRTVTNVAAGRISEESTDAINGSQLYYAIGKTEVNAKDIETNAGNITTNTTNIANLQKDVDNQGKLIDANSKLIDANTSRIDSIDTRLNNQDERMNQQDERLNDQEKRLDQVEKNDAVQNEKINQNTNAIEGLKEQQKSIDSKLDTMGDKIDGVKDDLTNYKEKTDKAIAENTADIAQNKNAIAQNKKEIEKNQQAIEKANNRLSEVEGQVNTNTTNIAEIKVSQQEQSRNLTEIKDQVSNNTSLITNVKRRVTKLGRRVANNTTKIDNHETRITSVETTVETHTAEIKENKENITKNAEAIKVNKDNIAANTQSINELAQAQQQSMDGIRHAINDVRKESRQGDAMNAALAALKPLQYDPDEKTQIMAGVGGYKGEHAVALGLAHFFNDSLMANIGGAYTSGSSMMWNAGVTIKFGSSHDKDDEHRRTTIEYTPDVVVKEHIATLEQEVATSKAEMAALRASSTAQINELQKQIEELKRLLTK